MKAIIGWKSSHNGDPLADVAYFLAMFLQPANYGYTYLQDCDLLMGEYFTSPYIMVLISFVMNCVLQRKSPHPCHVSGYPNRHTPSEDQILQAYCTEAKRYGITFSAKAFNYAKAITCLRLITCVKVNCNSIGG